MAGKTPGAGSRKGARGGAGKGASSSGYAPYGSRREEIVREAMRLFVAQGVAQTRMADVAKAVGIDQAILRYHFPSLDSLYAEVAQRTIDSYVAYSVEAAGKLPRDPLGQLKAYVQSYFKWVEEEAEAFSLFIHFYHLAALKPEFTEINERTRRTGRDRVEALLHRAIEAGQARAPKRLKVAELAQVVQTIIIGGVIAVSTESERAFDRASRLAWMQVESLLDWGGRGA